MADPLDLQIQRPPNKLVTNNNETPASDFDVDAVDLEVLEQRIEEIERYLGIEDMDLAYFYKEDGEDLNKKSHVLEDFMRTASDKCFCIKDLYIKYEKMEGLLKHSETFTQQCMDLKQKNNFIID